MKKRLIFIIAGVFVLLGIWLLWKEHTSHQMAPAATPSASRPSVQGMPLKAQSTPANGTTNPAAPIVPPPSVKKNKGELVQEAMNERNNKSLDFYGKVIDQNGNPIKNVKVKAGVGLYVSIDGGRGKDYYTETDAEGLFSFVGIHGAGVGFWLQKEGYEYNQRQHSSSRPNDYVPNSNSPTIFNMWKLKGAEPMVHIEAHCGLAVDGTATSFDLLTGKKTSGGDLAIRLVRNPVNIDRSKPFDWTLTLQVNGGGLIPVETVYTNEAPAEGYKSSVTVSMPASEKNWSPSFVQTYFFKARNGQVYGRITVNLMANYQPAPTHFEFEVYTNPSGSRNLEFDPARVVKP